LKQYHKNTNRKSSIQKKVVVTFEVRKL